MADEAVRSDGADSGKSKPKIDLKVTPNGKLRAVKEADSSEETDEAAEKADTENNGGEE